jgi:hypothetical protein
MTAYRERKRLDAVARGTTTTDADTEQPVTMSRATGAELLRQARDLADKLTATVDRFAGTMATLADPAAAEAEIEAARAAAQQQAAAAEAVRADAERRAARADQMRADADEAAEEMSTRLADAQDQVRQAHEQLAEAAAAHAAELDRIRRQTREQITAAHTERDQAVRAAHADRDAALAEAAKRRQEAQHAGERAAAAEARAQATADELTRVRDDAALALDQLRSSTAAELAQLRTDTTRERDELRALLEDRAATLTEARDAQRRRAERAEQDLDNARAESAQLRPKAGPAATSTTERRRRTSHAPES